MLYGSDDLGNLGPVANRKDGDYEMIKRLILAVCVAVVVGLLCALAGLILASIEAKIAVLVGGFLQTWAYAFGVIAGIWFYITGQPSLTP